MSTAAQTLARARIQRKIEEMADSATVALANRCDETATSAFLVRFEELPKLEHDFESLHEAIESSFDTDVTAEVIDQSNALYESVFRHIYAAKTAYRVLGPHGAEDGGPAHSTLRVSRTEPTSCDKLERLSIPIFDGDDDHWGEFCDAFVDLVRNRQDLPPSEKLQYLRKYLRGEPRQLIRSIRTTNGSFERAWHILYNKYEDPRRLVTHHATRIRLAPDQKKETFEATNALANTLREHLEALTAMSVSKDAILLSFIVQKLCDETRDRWEEASKDDVDPSLESFVSFLEQRAARLKTINAGKAKAPLPAVTPKKSFVTTTEEASTSARCELCDEPHQLYKCPRFKSRSVKERRALCAHNHCTNCLSSRHLLAKCNSTHSCRFCGDRHHSLLHAENIANRQQHRLAPPPTESRKSSQSVNPNGVRAW